MLSRVRWFWTRITSVFPLSVGEILSSGKLRSSAEKLAAINSTLFRPGGEDQECSRYVWMVRKFYPKLRMAVSVQLGACRGPERRTRTVYSRDGFSGKFIETASAAPEILRGNELFLCFPETLAKSPSSPVPRPLMTEIRKRGLYRRTTRSIYRPLTHCQRGRRPAYHFV